MYGHVTNKVVKNIESVELMETRRRRTSACRKTRLVDPKTYRTSFLIVGDEKKNWKFFIKIDVELMETRRRRTSACRKTRLVDPKTYRTSFLIVGDEKKNWKFFIKIDVELMEKRRRRTSACHKTRLVDPKTYRTSFLIVGDEKNWKFFIKIDVELMETRKRRKSACPNKRTVDPETHGTSFLNLGDEKKKKFSIKIKNDVFSIFLLYFMLFTHRNTNFPSVFLRRICEKKRRMPTSNGPQRPRREACTSGLRFCTNTLATKPEVGLVHVRYFFLRGDEMGIYKTVLSI